MKRFRCLIIILILTLLSSAVPPAFSSTAQAAEEGTGLEGLTSGAQSIVIGTVVESSSYWNDEHTRIFTSVVLLVEETLKGTINHDRIIVTYPGGKVGEVWLWVSTMPSLTLGEKAMVFLKQLPQQPLPEAMLSTGQITEPQFEVYSGFQGKFPIKGGMVGNIPLVIFKERVSKILRGQALPDEELAVPLFHVTFPFTYAGFC